MRTWVSFVVTSLGIAVAFTACKHDKVLGHCEVLAGAKVDMCIDHYSDREEAQRLCQEQQSARAQASTGGARWVDGKPCDRKGAVAGCRSQNGYTATWLYGTPEMCSDLVPIGMDWQPGRK